MSYSPLRIEDVAPTGGDNLPGQTMPKADIQPPQSQLIESQPAESQPVQSPTPAWFSTEIKPGAADAAAERYRERLAIREAERKADDEAMTEYRRRLDEKFKEAQGLYDKPGNDNPQEPAIRQPRQALLKEPILNPSQGQEFEPPRRAKSAPPSTFPYRKLAALSAAALLLGGALGAGFANSILLSHFWQSTMDHGRAEIARLSQPLANEPPMAIAGTGSTTIIKKPVAMASLSVGDAKGTLNSMIPLELAASSTHEDKPVDLMISGLPPSAYLSAGHQVEAGKWIVKLPETADLKLVVPQSQSPQINLEVAAVEQGSTVQASPAQNLQVNLADVKITPAAGTPDQAGSNVTIRPAMGSDKAQPIPLQPGMEFLAKADALMAQGDVLSARQYYLQAANMGNGKAMLGVARSYDPKVFAELKIEGLQPDAAKAADWYKKAQGAGVAAN